MRFKIPTDPPRGYSKFEFFLKSGYKVTAFYSVNYSSSYEKMYKKKLTHIEFYAETISETGYRSWFGNLEEFEDIEKGIRAVAELLEKKTITEYPNLLVEIQQPQLF